MTAEELHRQLRQLQESTEGKKSTGQQIKALWLARETRQAIDSNRDAEMWALGYRFARAMNLAGWQELEEWAHKQRQKKRASGPRKFRKVYGQILYDLVAEGKSTKEIRTILDGDNSRRDLATEYGIKIVRVWPVESTHSGWRFIVEKKGEKPQSQFLARDQLSSAVRNATNKK